MPDDLRKILDQQHPWYAAMAPLWRRYRAFGEGIDTSEDKKEWLPKGQGESDIAYAARLALTHDLGQSPSAVNRIKGALMRGEVSRDYEGGNAARMKAFDERAGGVGRDIESVLESGLVEAAKMGACFYFVGRRASPGAANAASEALPFVERWEVEELYDWGEDEETRLPTWAVLRRVVSVRSGPAGERMDRTTWLLLDRTTARRYVAESDTAAPMLVAEETHTLGVVPLVAHVAKDAGTYRGWSYIDALSRADLRRLQLESDNAASANLHAHPRFMVKSRKAWDQVLVGPSKTVFLNPDDDEDASYVTFDAGGRDTVSAMIEAGDRRGAELAGMDPATFAPGAKSATTARSGTAMQWAFATAEAPTLEDLYAGLVAADLGIHEIAARYFTPATDDPETPVFQGKIVRAKQWDFLALEDLLDVATVTKDDLKSETWRKELAKQIAQRVPGNLAPEVLEKVFAEIETADYSAETREPEGAAPGAPPQGPAQGPTRAAAS